MAKYITGTYTTTQVLSSPTTDNPATVTSTGLIDVNTTISSYVGLFGVGGYAWTVTNLGTVESVGYQGIGIDLVSGGSITNGTIGSPTALIQGPRFGIVITGAAGTVANYGTIESPGTFSYGVFLTAGGSVTNGSVGATGALIDGGTRGVTIVGDVGTVTNFGTIQSTYGVGVRMDVGGSVTNGASGSTTALISGVAYGVAIGGTAGTVSNYGTIEAGGTSGVGVSLNAGGSVTNALTGVIDAPSVGIRIQGAAGTVVNHGTIAGTGTSGVGVSLAAGGSVTNGASGSSGGLITGVANGVYIAGATGTVMNFGTIDPLATTSNGVYLTAGGTVTNGASGATGALITGYDGVRISGAAGTIANFGTIESIGTGFGAQAVDLLSGGTITNYGTIRGLGTDASGINAGFATDVIINGATGATGAVIEGWLNGIDQFSSVGTVINFGTVESTNGDAVYLQAGGTVTNYGTAGLIIGSTTGVRVGGAAGTVVNSGTIEATVASSVAVYSAVGGTVTNGPSGGTSALILGVTNGVAIRGTIGTVANYGTINATGTYGAAVYLADGGSVTNGASGATAALIVGNSNAVAIFFTPGTVTNFATIESIGSAGYGVVLSAGGSVANFGAILETGTSGAGVRLGADGTVANSGTIESTGDKGVYFAQGGTITNGTTDATGASISGLDTGIRVENLAGTVTNFATIGLSGTAGAGVLLLAGGSVSNMLTGLIEGQAYGTAAGAGVGIGFASGTVINYGVIDVTGAGYPTAIYLGAGGSVANYGTVSANGGGNGGAIGFALGGTITNELGGLLEASGNAVVINGSVGTVVNYGTVRGGVDGVDLKSAGSTVVNYGTITGTTLVGVYLYAGGSATNASTGVIEGRYDGVIATHSAGTVVNFGTIIAANGYGSGTGQSCPRWRGHEPAGRID